MIDVKVSYQGPFLDITRKREEQVRLERPKVRDLIELLGGCYGQRFKGLLIDPRTGEDKRSVIMIANGRRLEMDTELRAGDEVSFLTAIAGGSQS